MARKLNLDRPTYLNISLPESVRGQLDLHLWSDLEQRVPQGAYQALFLRLLREHFTCERIELWPGEWIQGSPEAIRYLQTKLETES